MKILGIRVDKVDMVQALCLVQKYIDSKKNHHVITLNAEIAYIAHKDPVLTKIIEQADLVTPDGVGILWAAKKLGEPLTERVTGIDLMQEICNQASHSNWSIYLLGANPDVLSKAITNLEERFPGLSIVGSHHGYFNKEEEAVIINEINKADPDLLFVALGAPKQEYWIADHRKDINSRVMIGVGGSFDVLAGHVKRAPAVWQKLKLEWLWRVVLNPSRLKRILALPKFVLAVEKNKIMKDKTIKEIKNKRDRYR